MTRTSKTVKVKQLLWWDVRGHSYDQTVSSVSTYLQFSLAIWVRLMSLLSENRCVTVSVLGCCNWTWTLTKEFLPDYKHSRRHCLPAVYWCTLMNWCKKGCASKLSPLKRPLWHTDNQWMFISTETQHKYYLRMFGKSQRIAYFMSQKSVHCLCCPVTAFRGSDHRV